MYTNQQLEKVKKISILIFLPTPRRNTSDKVYFRCVFHNEKQPSLVIYTKTNTYKCFGCGVQGDVINFVQKMCDMNFKETLEFLRKKYL